MRSFLICSAVLMAVLVTVNCDDHPIDPIPTSCPDEDSKEYTVHIAHETDCSKFYKCQGGEKIPADGLDCPKMVNGERLYFNPSLQVCDWPQNVHCKNQDPVDNDQPEDEQINYADYDY